jgi:hypothetical protein
LYVGPRLGATSIGRPGGSSPWLEICGSDGRYPQSSCGFSPRMRRACPRCGTGCRRCHRPTYADRRSRKLSRGHENPMQASTQGRDCQWLRAPRRRFVLHSRRKAARPEQDASRSVIDPLHSHRLTENS